MEIVGHLKFLGIHITDDFSWNKNIVLWWRKPNNNYAFWEGLQKAGMSNIIMINFYRCVVESILTNNITICFGSCSAADRRALQRVVKTVQKVTASSLPSMEDIYKKVRCLKRATNIIKDNAHSAAGTLLPTSEDSEVCDHELQDWEIVYFFRRSGYITSVADQCSHFVLVSLGGPAMDIEHYVMVRHCS